MSKDKVAPLKKITLHRLELMPCLITASLLKFVKECLMLSDCVVWTYWTDSTSVLSWIKSDPGRWKPFVLNCLREIQHITSYADWGHCPGNWVILRICGVEG